MNKAPAASSAVATIYDLRFTIYNQKVTEISVLIPSYNHAPFIERTLRSIYGQTLRPKKLIVIDDGSKDESVAVIERVLKDYPFDYEFVKRENRGVCATLNEGFAKTDGDYFAYLGSDDVWLPNFLEEQVALLESRPKAVLAFAHAYVIDEDDNIIDRTDNWTEFADGDLLPVLLRGEIFSSPGVVYRRSVLEKHKWNEDAALEDYEMYLVLTTEGEFARNENLICAWRQHGWNTSSDYPRMFQEQLNSQSRMAGILNLSTSRLEKIQREMKFMAVTGYLRSGNRRKSVPLLWENLSGATSTVELIKTLARLSVPQTLFLWNRRRKRKVGIRKYGKLRMQGSDAK